MSDQITDTNIVLNKNINLSLCTLCLCGFAFKF